MAISRRAFGIGLIAASAAGTGGYVYLRQHPELAGRFGDPKRLFGFSGGEKEGFLANARVRSLLERRFGLILELTARRLGRDGARTRAARSEAAIPVAVVVGAGRGRTQFGRQDFARPGDLQFADRALFVGPDRGRPGEGRLCGARRRAALHGRPAQGTQGHHRRRNLGGDGRRRPVRPRPHRLDRSQQIQFGFHVRRARGQPAERRRDRARFARPHRWRRRDRVPPDGVQAAVVGQTVRRLCGRRRRRPAA